LENELFYISLLFLFLIVLFLFLSNFLVSNDSPFQFNKSGEFTIEKETKNGVKYYVKYRHAKSNLNLDSEVDSEWYRYLQSQCHEEDDANYRFRKLERKYMESNNVELSRKYREKLSSDHCDAFTSFHRKLAAAAAA
jgi:hypothetical protein